MFVSFSAVALAATLSVGVVPADLPAPGVAPGVGPGVGPAAASEAAAPLWWQLFVGEYFEENFLDIGDGRSWTYRIAGHSMLPKGLELDEKTGKVHGVPEEETVQLTTFVVIDDETGAEFTEYQFFHVNNPVLGAPVPAPNVPHIPEQRPEWPDWPNWPEWPLEGAGAIRG